MSQKIIVSEKVNWVGLCPASDMVAGLPEYPSLTG